MNPNAEVIHGGLPRKTDDNNIVVGEVPETENRNISFAGSTFMKHMKGSRYFSDPSLLDQYTPYAICPDNGTYVVLPHADLHEELVFNLERFLGRDCILAEHYVASCKKDKETGQDIVGAKVVGMLALDVFAGAGEDRVQMVAAFRNSVDRSTRFALAGGMGVFACDNLSISGELVFGYRHTKNVIASMRAQVTELASSMEERFIHDQKRISALKALPVNTEQGQSVLTELYKAGCLDTVGGPLHSPYGISLREWEDPQFGVFEDRNAWSLWNAATFGMTHGLSIGNVFKSNKAETVFDNELRIG